MVLPPLQLSETTASTAAPQYFETPVLLIFSSRRFGPVLVFCSVLFCSVLGCRQDFVPSAPPFFLFLVMG